MYIVFRTEFNETVATTICNSYIVEHDNRIYVQLNQPVNCNNGFDSIEYDQIDIWTDKASIWNMSGDDLSITVLEMVPDMRKYLKTTPPV